MTDNSTPRGAQELAKTVTTMEIALRLSLLAVLVVFCFQILHPFLPTIVWALIIAAALHPTYDWALHKFGRSNAFTSTVFTTLILALLMTPIAMLSGTLVESARGFASELHDGSLVVPPPPERLKELPLVGEKTFDAWLLATENLSGALEKFEAQIKTTGRWLLSTAAGAGLGIAQFALALVISGVFLAHSVQGGAFARRLGRRLAGTHGENICNMASQTVRSVAQGVLGVAFIQAILAGLGFMAMDIPGAGLWTLLVLILATVQLPCGLVLIPSIFYVLSTADTVPAVIYTGWMIMVSLIDNILKPLLLGRGASVPMIVIFLGAIGGFVWQGIVGLFLGAIVLSLGYELFGLWMNLDQPDTNPDCGD